MMTKLTSLWGRRGHPAPACERVGGGVDDLATRPRVGSAFRLSTIGALLVGLGMLVASPQPSAAQGTCTLSDGTEETLPTDPNGKPPRVTKTDPYGKHLRCRGLTNGLELTLDDFKIGTSAAPVTEPIGLDVDAEGAEDDHVTVMGKVVIHSNLQGIGLVRNGTGWLKLQLDPDSKINAALSKGEVSTGIYLKHTGEAKTNNANGVTKGIHLVSSADVDVSQSTAPTGKIAITATTEGAADGTTIPITIHLKGGSILAGDTSNLETGVRVIQQAKGKVDITVDPGVMIGMEGKSIGNRGIDATIFPKGDDNLMITHSGHIYADKFGIFASFIKIEPSDTPAGGNITIETGADSAIVASGYGIAAYLNERRTGTIEINHYGKITAGAETGGGTLPAGIHAQAYTAVSITMEAGSRITATRLGIRARVYAGAKATVETKEGSVITADRYGIMIDKRGSAKDKFTLTIRGTVMGGGTPCTDTKTGREKCAGVRIRRASIVALGANEKGGGTIVIGPRAHVKASSGVAIEVDPKTDDDQPEVVAVILEKDEAGVVGHVEGQILNPATVVEGAKREKTRSTLEFKVSGSKTVLAPGAIIHRRGQRMGVYEQVFKAKLETITDGYQFKDVASAPVLRLYSHRARLYEVLPSVLLGLVDLTPYSTRMAVPRRSTGDEEVMVESSKGEHVAVPGSRTGVWVRLAVRDGERMADTSTTATDFWRQSLAWDVQQTDFEAGLEVPTDERLVLGVSAHYRQSEATVKRGGTMEASGTGVGVSLTWTDDSGLYVDGQLSYTRFFDITMVSANSAVGAITSTGGGNGLALGVEVGQPMSMGGLTVIPRGGLSWSSVDLDAFDEPTTIDGAGRVTPDKEQSVQGRVGVLAELGPKDANGRLYASLDLEHEFSSKHAVMVAGTRLTTEVKPTWVRLGVGGVMSLGSGDTTQLTGDAFYATAGSDNADFGGGLSVTFRF